MLTDILYVAWNRLEFTKETFEALVANTDWSLVHRLYVADDGSTDGTDEWLSDACARVKGVEAVFSPVRTGSPVAVMNRYVARSEADAFVKLDNDILVPPGWLERLVEEIEADGTLDLLGMQVGRQRELVEQGIVSAADMEMAEGVGWIPAPHIGGVGIMRTRAFWERPHPEPDGRFGFTAWQQAFDESTSPPPLVRGWIVPDIVCPQMDFLPFEPWASLSQEYRDAGWQRSTPDGRPVWPPYDPADHAWWDWAFPNEGEA